MDIITTTLSNLTLEKIDNIIYLPDIKIGYKYEKLRLNNNILERSKDGIIWKKVCNFLFNNEQCYNYITKNCFCGKHQDGLINTLDRVNIGDMTEKWLFDLIKQSNQLINIQIIGQSNCKLDIIYQVKDEVERGIIHYRGIQVKTLCLSRENYFSINDLKKYDKDTLIAGIDKERKCMCLIVKTFIGDIDVFGFNISNPSLKVKPYIFNGLNDNSLGYNFFNTLIYHCKFSTIYTDDQFNSDNLKERDMLLKLEKKCKENNLSFRINSTSNSSIDCFIDNKTIQCKFSSQIISNLYYFSLNHTIDNKCGQSYTENDVDLFIFQHEKEETFYIIPQNVLIHFGYLKTNLIEGKLALAISPSSYKEDHWTKLFINNFHVINNEYDLSNLINLDNIVDKFQQLCKENNIICNQDMVNLTINNGIANQKKVKFCKSSRIVYKNYEFYIAINNIPYHTKNNNIPDFFIFRIDQYPDDFYIFPKEILIEKEIIGTDDQKGSKKIFLPIPRDESNRKKWVIPYLNNFDLLKSEE